MGREEGQAPRVRGGGFLQGDGGGYVVRRHLWAGGGSAKQIWRSPHPDFSNGSFHQINC
jgi:hypothetical protein